MQQIIRIETLKWNIFFVLLIVIGLLYVSFYHFLDDAFIHLRYAHNLLNIGFISYNGIEKDFGNSSPLYVLILAFFSSFSMEPILPKIINIICYLGFISTLIYFIFIHDKQNKNSILWFCTFLIFASPFSIRWLTDGMETVLIIVFSLLLAIIFNSNGIVSKHLFFNVFIAINSCLAVLLRVEFLYVIFFICLSLSVGKMAELKNSRIEIKLRKLLSIDILSFAIGSLIAALLIYIYFGELLPDTAVAKKSDIVGFDVFATLITIAKAHVASDLFGIGLFLLWFTSAFLVIHKTTDPIKKLQFIILNFSMLVFVIMLILSQQSIQGIRYFLFIESFLLFCNLLGLKSIRIFVKIQAPVMAVMVLVFISLFSFDTYKFLSISKGRSETFFKFLETDLGFIQNKTCLAYDIGMAGFFSRTHIFDGNGLVNGRNIAKLTSTERLKYFANKKIDCLFVNTGQLKSVNKYIDTSNWNKIGKFNFPNFSGKLDSHYFLFNTGIKNEQY
jgi:hypothetical protein